MADQFFNAQNFVSRIAVLSPRRTISPTEPQEILIDVAVLPVRRTISPEEPEAVNSVIIFFANATNDSDEHEDIMEDIDTPVILLPYPFRMTDLRRSTSTIQPNPIECEMEDI